MDKAINPLPGAIEDVDCPLRFPGQYTRRRDRPELRGLPRRGRGPVNRAWGGRKIAPYPDLLCHEDPEYWAYGLYYDDADGDEVPYWDPDTDRSTWTVNSAPPDGDPAWTLPREG
ncbi:hypothetical protein AB0O31_18305 [Kitasatospora cineracea]|uniref:hypothetical protein n=1 Tax=Kitasatospora cineracea TaxID=88074 RepID=UPI00344247B1